MNDIEKAIADIQAIKSTIEYKHGKEYGIESLDKAIEALREKAERENPKPLTLEELMQRDGKPVFTLSGDEKGDMNGWFIVCASTHNVESEHGFDTAYNLVMYNAYDELCPEQAFYGMECSPASFEYCSKKCRHGLHQMGWLAYDYEPKGGEKNER